MIERFAESSNAAWWNTWILQLRRVLEYNAEYAQNDAERQHSAKGPAIKLGADWKLVEGVKKLIKEHHYSPYAIIQHFEHNGWPSDTRICEKTLYNYIQAGDITDST